MDIGLFSDSLKEVNGVTRMIRDLTTGLEQREHSVVAFGPGKEESSLFEFPFPPCPDYTASIPHLRKIYNSCKHARVQLVHAHTPFSMGIASIIIKKGLNLPSVGTFHTLIPEYMHYVSPVKSERLKRIAWDYLARVYSHFDVVTCPSKSIRDELSSHRIQADVISNGVDIKRFNPRVASRPFLDKCPVKKGYFISVGRLAKEKRLDWMIEAAHRRPGLSFVIGGKGQQLPDLKQSSGKNVKFTGFIDDAILPSAYKGAAAFIMCSKTETQGLVCLEAMACGTPVIAYDCPTNRETVKDGGLYFTDVEGLEDGIDALHDPARRNALSKHAVRVAQKCSLDTMVDKYVRLYSSLIK